MEHFTNHTSTPSKSRLIIASNRLPYQYDKQAQQFEQASGGLTSVILGSHDPIDKLWVGLIGEHELENWENHAPTDSKTLTCHPIPIDAKSYHHYYDGFSNSTLWPLFHYQTNLIEINDQDWHDYQQINQLFAQHIDALYRPGDIIWIHDYHLCLLPQYLKAVRPDIHIGWFLHIPFPNPELFLTLPAAKALLQGILSADLVGFQDYNYLQNFCRSAQRILGVCSHLSTLSYKHRKIALGVFPTSIDYARYHHARNTPPSPLANHKHPPSAKMILGVDRLDYIKGIDLKILAFKQLLNDYPQLREQVYLLQIAVPSREQVKANIDEGFKIKQLVNEVNAEYATTTWTPIHYHNLSVSFETLVAHYRQADVLLITSKYDGMNLVAMEYIAAQQPDNPGMLVLSQFTGAKTCLPGAISINPYHTKDTANTLYQALTLDTKSKRQACEHMQQHLCQYTATHWSSNFIAALKEIHLPDHHANPTPISNPATFSASILSKTETTPLTLFLDYDGTLVELCAQPHQATLPSPVQALISRLAACPSVQVVIISGREKDFLATQFTDNNIYLSAEHGAYFYNGQGWVSTGGQEADLWYDNAYQLMAHYTKYTPGSHIEKKQSSLSWHYRQSDNTFSSAQALKLYDELHHGMAHYPVDILHGNKVIEACAFYANKGRFVNWFLQQHPTPSTVLGLGDDTTDEKMFSVLNQHHYISIKVGEGTSQAQYRLANHTQVIALLTQLHHKLCERVI